MSVAYNQCFPCSLHQSVPDHQGHSYAVVHCFGPSDKRSRFQHHKLMRPSQSSKPSLNLPRVGSLPPNCHPLMRISWKLWRSQSLLAMCTCTMASTSIGTPMGSVLCPMALRADFPASPKTSIINSVYLVHIRPLLILLPLGLFACFCSRHCILLLARSL